MNAVNLLNKELIEHPILTDEKALESEIREIVLNVKSSRLLKEAISELGGKLLREC